MKAISDFYFTFSRLLGCLVFRNDTDKHSFAWWPRFWLLIISAIDVDQSALQNPKKFQDQPTDMCKHITNWKQIPNGLDQRVISSPTKSYTAKEVSSENKESTFMVKSYDICSVI